MKKYLVVFLTLALSSLSFAQMPSMPKRPSAMNMPRHEAMMAKLNLTDKQKEDLKNLRFETQKKQIELRSKLAESKLELAKLLDSDSPNQAAIEKQMKEVADNTLALRTNHLDAWFEANKQLTPEQQKIWRGMLRHVVQQRAMQHGMMGRGGMMQMKGRMNGQGGCDCGGMGMNGPMK